MRNRFWLLQRGEVFYLEDTETRKQFSLKTRDRKVAEEIQRTRNASFLTADNHLLIAQAHLQSADPQFCTRTWQMVMDRMGSKGKESSRKRVQREMRSPVFDAIRSAKIVETKADDFMKVLDVGGASTNAYLRCLQNLALGLGWLIRPIIPQKLWPLHKAKPKRAITFEEHQKILAAEKNQEWRQYFEMLWEIGAAQTDAANLCAENIDSSTMTLAYRRQKTGEWAHIRIGEHLASLLKQLPQSGLLFPAIAPFNDSGRAWHFSKRCKRAGVVGVTLHSYRYAWAERANTAGYPERWAQAALGHNSRAVHQAYAKKAKVICPSLEEYERKIVPMMRATA